MKRLNYVAIIQVRTGSKRLPKKSLIKLSGLRIIDWVIKRTKKTSLIDEIIIATTKKKEDRVFSKIAKKNKVKIFYGEETNVLKRFCDTAERFNIKNIVRICADRPFISPDFIDNLILFFKKNKCDLAFNHVSEKKFKFRCMDGFGAEIFSTESLNKIKYRTKNKSNLEHVTKYFYLNNEFKVKPVPLKKIFTKPNISLDIDTKEDLLFLKTLVKRNKIKIHSKPEKIAKAAIDVKI